MVAPMMGSPASSITLPVTMDDWAIAVIEIRQAVVANVHLNIFVCFIFVRENKLIPTWITTLYCIGQTAISWLQVHAAQRLGEVKFLQLFVFELWHFVECGVEVAVFVRASARTVVCLGRRTEV